MLLSYGGFSPYKAICNVIVLLDRMAFDFVR